MWEAANRYSVKFDHLVGTTPGAVVVGYGDGADTASLRIPLDADGELAAPFAAGGNPTTTEEMWRSLEPSREAAILNRAGQAVWFDPNWRHECDVAIVREKGYLPMEVRPNDTGPNEAQSRFRPQVDVHGKLVAVGYRHDGARWVAVSLEWSVPASTRPSDRPDPVHLIEPGTKILLLPAERPRAAIPRHDAQVRATLLTPVTATVDAAQTVLVVALFPVVLVTIAPLFILSGM